MNLPTLGVLDAPHKDEAWVARIKRVRNGWVAVSGVFFLAILAIEILSQFTANPLYLLALVAIFIVDFMIVDICGSRIEDYESDKIWAQFNQEEQTARDNGKSA